MLRRAAIVEHGNGGDRGECAGERTHTSAGAPCATRRRGAAAPMMQIAAFVPGRAPPQELPKDVSAAAWSSEKTLASPADSINAELGAAVKPAKSKNPCYEQAECTSLFFVEWEFRVHLPEARSTLLFLK